MLTAKWLPMALAVLLFAFPTIRLNAQTLPTETGAGAGQGGVALETLALPDPLPGTSADRLLDGQPPLTSFEALQALPGFERGLEVIVTDETGTTTTARIASVSSSQLEVVRPRRNGSGLASWFRPSVPELRTFSAGSVRIIKVVDSPLNGAIIGGIVGLGAIVAAVMASEDVPGDILSPESLYGIWGGLSIGAVVGGIIDSRINRPIYERAITPPPVTFAPLIRRDATGVLARVSF